MRIGIHTAQRGRLARPAAVRAVAAAADHIGYSSLWALDDPGLAAGTGLDALGVLTMAAATTTRVRLGAAVAVTSWPAPDLLARALATLHVLSDGRLTVALTGDDRVDHTLDGLDACWDGDPARPRPTVLVAGTGPAALRRAACRADGWSPAGVPAERLGPAWARVRELAAGAGRDPDSLLLVVRADMALTDRPVGGPRPSWHGTPDQVADDIEAAGRAGAGEVVLGLSGDPGLDEALDGYARVAEAVELRAASAV